jgi:hypothetical protein
MQLSNRRSTLAKDPMAAMMPHIVLVGQSPVVSQIDRSHGIENGGAFGIIVHRGTLMPRPPNAYWYNIVWLNEFIRTCRVLHRRTRAWCRSTDLMLLKLVFNTH